MPNPLTQLSNPDIFMRWTKPWIPITGVGALLCILFAGTVGLFFSPEDIRQGESVRIMYVHVPAAWLALQTYAFIAVASLVSFIWRH
ncbi:MAG: heme transporter HemC, partial [Parvularculaceae bacterium]|nr:heme transporter HemC [Parvularculaceae bacterium]